MNTNRTSHAYCRLCAKFKPLKRLTNLKDNEEMCREIVEKLSRFNIELHENVLPKTVCLVCIKSLDRAFAFVTAIEQTQETLSDFILVQVNNDIDEEIENFLYESPGENKDDNIEIKSEANVNKAEDITNEGFSEDVKSKDDDNNNVEIKHTVCLSPNIDDISVKNEVIYDELLNVHPNSSINDITTSINQNIITKPGLGDEGDINYKINVDGEDSNIKDYNTSNQTPKVNYDTSISEGINTTNKDKTISNELSALQIISPLDNISTQIEKESNQLENLEYTEEFIEKQLEKLASIPLHEIKITWRNFPWKCTYCKLQFPTIHDLQNHSMEKHSSCNAYQCSQCNTKRSSLKQFLKHVRKHSLYLHYSCHLCFMTFSTPDKTRNHKATDHNFSGYRCTGCYTSFTSLDLFKKHKTNYFKIIRENFKRPERSPNGYFECDMCPKSYKKASGIMQHLKKHMDTATQIDHVCEICGKGFFSKQTLLEHLFVHSDERPYQCEICKFNFKSIKQMKKHTAIHSRIKPFSCNQCSKCFPTKYRLTNHMIIHTDIKPYSCTYCNKKFRTKSILRNHLPQHTGLKAYSCDICSRGFVDLGNRNKHMKRKHGIIKAKKRNILEGHLPEDPTLPETDKQLKLKKIPVLIKKVHQRKSYRLEESRKVKRNDSAFNTK